uniref:(northern house mosquito) hypothetical protein n=1 Tax=Culex pipiens TaxID=7175 RepID=A0A8D8DUQ7_CULPI
MVNRVGSAFWPGTRSSFAREVATEASSITTSARGITTSQRCVATRRRSAVSSGPPMGSTWPAVATTTWSTFGVLPTELLTRPQLPFMPSTSIKPPSEPWPGVPGSHTRWPPAEEPPTGASSSGTSTTVS